jgi:hypothetical protein
MRWPFPYRLYPGDETCPECCGTRWVKLEISGTVPCEHCNFTGVINAEDEWRADLADEPSPSGRDYEAGRAAA